MGKKVKPIKVIEKILPGRVDTAAFHLWEKDHGIYCLGCDELVETFFSNCSCPQWQEAIKDETR